MICQPKGQTWCFTPDFLRMLAAVENYAPLTGYNSWGVYLRELFELPDEQKVVQAVQAFENYGLNHYGKSDEDWPGLNVWTRSILGITVLILEAAYADLPDRTPSTREHQNISTSIHGLKMNLRVAGNAPRACIGQLIEELFQEAQKSDVGRVAFYSIVDAVHEYDPRFSDTELGQIVKSYVIALHEKRVPNGASQNHPMLIWLTRRMAEDHQPFSIEPNILRPWWQKARIILGGTPTCVSGTRVTLYVIGIIFAVMSGYCLLSFSDSYRAIGEFEEKHVTRLKQVLLRQK